MTTTDTTKVMLPLHPFQQDLAFLTEQDPLAKKDTFKLNSATLTSPPSSSSSSSSSSSPSSHSSSRASRSSLPSLWNNSQMVGDAPFSMDPASCLPTTSSASLWSSYTQTDSTTTTAQTPNVNGTFFSRRSSLSHTPPSSNSFGWTDPISPNGHPLHSLRNIWSAPPVDSQGHQRRLSLCDFTATPNCWYPFVPESRHEWQR